MNVLNLSEVRQLAAELTAAYYSGRERSDVEPRAVFETFREFVTMLVQAKIEDMSEARQDATGR